MPGISDTLELDIQPALSAVDQLGLAITSTMAAAAVSLQGDISSALADVLGNIEANITADVTADTSEAATALADLDAETVDVPVEADTVAAQADISALDAETVVAPVSADTSEAVAAIADLSSEPVEVAVEANTGDAKEQLSGLAESSKQGAEGLGALSVAGLGVESSALKATAGFAGFVGVLGEFAHEALNADATNRRFISVFENEAEQVDKIDIAGLNTDFDSLTLSIGANADSLKASITSFGAMQKAVGASVPEAGALAEQFGVLADYLSVSNPKLGTADEVAQRLTASLARGGRFAASTGLSFLTLADITARASEQTGKEANELTLADKAAAGLSLSMEKLGGKIAGGIASGIEAPTVKLRSFQEEVRRTAEEAGKPLIDPLIADLEKLLPALTSTATLIGTVGATFLDILNPALTVAGPIVEFVGSALDALPGPLQAVLVGVIALEVAARTFDLTGIGLALTALAIGVGVVQSILGDDSGAEKQQKAVDELSGSLFDAAANAEDAGKVIRDSLDDLVTKGEDVATVFGSIDIGKAFGDAGLTVEGFSSLVEQGREAVDRFLHTQADAGNITAEQAIGLQNLAQQHQLAASAALQDIEKSSQYNVAQQEAAKTARLSADETGNYVSALEAVQPQLDQLGASTSGAALTQEQLDKAIADTNDSLEKANEALDDAISKLEDFLGIPISAEEEVSRFQGGLDDLTEALKKNGLQLDATGANFDLTTDKGREVASTFGDLGKQAIDSSVAVLQQGGSVEDAANKFDLLTAAIAQQAIESGLSQEQVQALLATLGLTRDDFVAKVEAAGVPEAKQGVGELNKQLTDLDGRVVQTQVLTVFRSVDESGHAINLKSSGGPVFPGVEYTVGERRPELFIGASGASELIGVFGQERRRFEEPGFIVPKVAALPRALSRSEAPTAALAALSGLSALSGPSGAPPVVQVPSAVQVSAPAGAGSVSLDPDVVAALRALAEREFPAGKSFGDLIVQPPASPNPELWALSLLDALKRRA